MARHDHDLRFPSPAVERARHRDETRRAQHAEATGLPPSLDVHVDDLAEGVLDIETTIAADAMTALLDEGKEVEWTASSDAKVKLRLQREAGFVHVRGQARFALRHPCVRCLNAVPFDVPLDVDLRLVRTEASAAAHVPEAEAEEGELGELGGDAGELEDLGVASFVGDTIHLAQVLREQLFLELPMHPACDSPRARPAERCAFDASGALKREQERWVDPRWAGLQKLKEQLVASQPKDLATGPATPAVPLPGASRPVPLPGKNSAPVPLPGRATASKPAAKKAKPAAKKAKPAARKAKPAAKKAKPAAKKVKPAARKAKPAARKAKPAAKKAKPATRKAKPAAKKAKARR